MTYHKTHQALGVLAANVAKLAYHFNVSLDDLCHAPNVGVGNDKLTDFLSPANPIVVPPSYPSSGTQSARLLAWFLSGRSIDPLTAWVELGIYRLSDAVYRLRNARWRVITAEKEVSNRYGEMCVVANYYLDPEWILDAGKAGHQFMIAECEAGHHCAAEERT